MRETFQTPGPVVLDLRVPAGDIEIETGTGKDTVVEVTGLPEEELLEIVDVDLRERGGAYEVVVVVDERSGWSRFFKGRDVHVAVVAPDGAEARVRTGSADVRGRGRFGAVAVNTGSGDVSFDSVDGEAEVKSASGDVRLGDVAGAAAVSTASGDVNVDRVGAEAQVRSASGDVRIGDAASDVTVQTASGDVQVGAVSEGQVSLQSASGDMLVGVRRGSRLAVDAKSMSGDTSSEIELGGEVVHDAADEGPLVELRATSMSGDISVVRA